MEGTVDNDTTKFIDNMVWTSLENLVRDGRLHGMHFERCVGFEQDVLPFDDNMISRSTSMRALPPASFDAGGVLRSIFQLFQV